MGLIVCSVCVATVEADRFFTMGNAFDRVKERVTNREASRIAAAEPDPAKVQRIPAGRYRPASGTSPYEQGVFDGLHGKNPGQEAGEGRQFGAYLDGLKAGNRARMLKARQEQKASSERVIPQRQVPTEAEVAAELAEREALDEARKARRRESGILKALAG
jgi:hypothetical protein